MIAFLLMQAIAALPLPALDHTKAIKVTPISGNVIMCTSAEMLPLTRLAWRSVHSGGPDYGVQTLMTNGGCIPTITTEPALADFQENVSWAGALQPPKMLHGNLQVVRIRVSDAAPDAPELESYYYIAAEDLRR